MTWTSDLALSALWFGAGAAAAWRFTMLHYQSRLSAATQSANLFAAWWERDSAKMLVAEAKLDLIHEQRRAAGRQSHKAERPLIANRTEMLRECVEHRMGFPADLSAGRSTGRTAQAGRSTGQDAGAGILPDVTLRASAGNKPGRSCGRNRAGNSAPAEAPKMKGA